MKRALQILQNKWLLAFLYVSGVFLIIGRIYYSYKEEVWLDPAIIMTEMESIARGYIPYETMHLNYPPLFFYMMVGLKKLFGIPYGYYNFYLSVYYLFLFGCAVCLYVIARQLTGKKRLSGFSAWLFVLVMLKLGAYSVRFDVPSMFFGLLSCMLCLLFRDKHPSHFIYIGMTAVCSFLVKQFGLGYFVLVLYLLLCYCNNKKGQRSLFFCLGYLIPIAIVLALFGAGFIKSTLLNGYGTTVNAMRGEDVSIGFKFGFVFDNAVKAIVKSFMIVLSAMCMLPLFYKQRKWQEVVFCFCGFAGFCLQYYFCASGSFLYWQYMAPFAILMIPVIAMLDFKKKYAAIAICIAGLLITMYKPLRNGLRYSVKNPIQHYCETGRIKQLENSTKICKYMDKESTIWIANTGLQKYYYFADLPTPNMKQVGYSAGPWEITMESAALQVKSADYVLCDGGVDDYFDNYLVVLRPYIECFHCDTISDQMLLFDMRKPIKEVINPF